MSKNSSQQQCPICRVKHPLSATRCDECGAALSGVPMSATPVIQDEQPTIPIRQWEIGDADLYEGALPPVPFQIIAGVFVGFIAVIGVIVLLTLRLSSASAATSATEQIVVVNITPTVPSPTPPPTNTKIMVMPTLEGILTVTPQPPTPSITPTRGPCIQKARKGDTVLSMAMRCGHRDLSIVDLVLQDNDMKDPGQLQIGQTLEIPWPTPKGADSANAPQDSTTGTPGPASTSADQALAPGQAWYTVQKGDTAISIAVKFKTVMKNLHDLNPQITFDQCDFSLPTGGPNCTLIPILAPGMKVRVPVPLPTPTRSPTPNGSETPTPTLTPTFNVPVSLSPGDNMLFESDQLPTLRWSSTGELSSSQAYLITLEDTTANIMYYLTTRDLSYQVPADYQPSDGKRHIFSWFVAVADMSSGTPTPLTYHTETRTFTWQSR